MNRLRTWAASATELLDDPAADAGDVVASLRDIARINRAFGGAAAAVSRVDEFLAGLAPRSTVTLLDVGTGAGDIPLACVASAQKRSIRVRVTGVERIPAAAREAARTCDAVVIADGCRLPFSDRSFDLVLCAKLLHHLPGEAGRLLLREMDRVARLGVVVADIRRSVVAAAGLWIMSFPMHFHPATRRDGVISVFRGFTPVELGEVCRGAGLAARVKRHPGWSLTAAWRPGARA